MRNIDLHTRAELWAADADIKLIEAERMLLERCGSWEGDTISAEARVKICQARELIQQVINLLSKDP